jgi:hypothetical protein
MSYSGLSFDLINENTTDESIDLTFSKSFNDNFLDRMSDYKVSLTRILLPTQLLQNYDIKESEISDYGITLSFRDSYDNYPYTSTHYLLSNNSQNIIETIDVNTNPRKMQTYGYYEMYDRSSILDNINRTILRCWYDILMKNSVYSGTGVSDPFYKISDNVANNNLTTYVYNNTFPDKCKVTISTPVTTSTQTILVRVYLNNINYTTSSPTAVDNGIIPFNIYLKTPDDKQILLCANDNDFNLNGLSRTICFCDSSMYNITEYKSDDIVTIYRPQESFSKLYKDVYASLSGTFSLVIVPAVGVTYSCTVDARIELYANNTANKKVDASDNYMTYAPFYNFNSDNKLVFNYEVAMREKQIKLEFTKKLFSLVRFDNFFSYNKTSGLYKMIYSEDAEILNADKQILTMTQEISTSYLFVNLSQIIVTSSLPIRQDAVIKNYILTTQDILTDFFIDDSNTLNNLTFSYDGSYKPLRSYDLLSNGPLQNINVSVYALYRNGSQKLITMQPGSQALIKLSFTRDN